MDKLREIPSEILLHQQHQNQIIQLAKDGSPLETCGLIAGKSNISKKIFPITNIENSPTSFRMDPQEQLDALLDIERYKYDLLAIYHSHPNGPDHPSITDISKSYYPNTPNIIVCNKNGYWELNAFIIAGSLYQKIEIKILDN